MVKTLDFGQIIVKLSYFRRFQWPALSTYAADNLVIILGAPSLGSLRVCRSIQHERVHGPRDVPFSFGYFFLPFLGGTIHPSLHISERHCRHMLRENAQRLSNLGRLILRRFLSRLCRRLFFAAAGSGRSSDRATTSSTPTIRTEVGLGCRWEVARYVL